MLKIVHNATLDGTQDEWRVTDGQQLSVVVADEDAARAMVKRLARNARQRTSRRIRDDAMRSLGLVKVKGGRGGTYWE